MSNTNHDFLVKNGLVVGQAITSTGTLTQAGQTFPASDGSAGQYLKTNGSGALSWGTVSTSFNITDGTTTDTVGLTETVTFTGGTNISLAVTDNTVTITNDVVDSDDITEGSSNLFYTDARAIAAIQGASNLTIDGGTLYVDTAADRVGISDTSPQQKLDVAGNIGVNGSEVIDASGNIVGSVADSAMTVGGSLAGVLSNLKVQYGTSYSGTPIQGSFFFDSLNQKLKVYTGSAFIDAVPAGSGGGGGGGATDANTTFRNYSYTLTGTTSAVSGVDDNELTAGAFIIGHKYTITSVGNTDFTAIGASGNTVGVVFTATGVGSGTGQAKQTLFYDTTSSATRVVAYVNGIKQVYGSGRDFVATTGTSVAFTYNLGSGDTVDIQVYELLTNDAYYVKSEVYTQTEVNSQISTGVSSYLPLAGGTLTGDLIINTSSNGMLKLQEGGNDKGYIGAGGGGLYIKNLAGDVIFRNSSDADTIRIKDSGNVGIGTTNPKRSLQIGATGSFPISFNGNYPDIHMNTYYESGWRIHTAGFGAKTTFNGATGAFGFSNVASTQVAGATFTPQERLTILANGNIGIGTNNPAELLHLKKSSGAPILRLEAPASELTRIELGDGSNYTHISSRPDMGDGLMFYENGAVNTVMRGGKVGINNNNPSQRLTVNSPGGAGANAAGRFSEVMAQIHETGGQTQAGRRSIMFFNDINNWYNGTEKTVVGMAFNNNGAIRGGIQYDHKNTERMTMWSGYGPIEFKVPSVTNQGDYRADQVDLTPLTIENLTGSVRINNQKPSTAVNITEAQSIYSLSLKNRDNGTRLSFSGDTTLSSTIQSMNPNNNGPAHIKLNPFGGKTVIGTYDEVGHNNDLTVDQGIYIQNAVPSTSQYVANAVLPNYAITIPVTAGFTSQTVSNGGGWANIGWQPTARSGEVMHRNTNSRYKVGGSGDSMGFYIEAGTSEAGGMCFDEDSTQVYGSSDNGTTFRIIDKDSDIVIMEMLQSSWNMSVRGNVSSSQSSFSGLSDRRVKKGFQDVSTENILTKYNNLDLKSYIRIDSYDYMKDNYENEEDLREIGLVAQEVEEIFPDVVGTTPVVDPRGMDSVWEELGEELTEIKNINQTGLLYKTIEAVQALIEENTALKARLDALEE